MKKGDILICSTNKSLWGENIKQLLVGDKYIVKDVIEMSEMAILNITHINTGEDIGLYHQRHFIPLEVWREFQFRKILD